MSKKLPNYLRTHRRRMGLTQKQVAFLLGIRSVARISRYERFHKLPDLRTALGFEAVFHAPVRELFAGPYEEVEHETERRAQLLAARPAREADQATKRSATSRGTMKSRG